MGMGEDAAVASKVDALLAGAGALFEPVPPRSPLAFPASASPFAAQQAVSPTAPEALSDAEFEAKLRELESLLKNGKQKLEAPAAGKLTSLSCYPESPILISAGTTRRVIISGNYSRGKTKNVSHKKDGTQYTVEDAAIAAVDENGMLTALKPGRTSITAVNGESSVSADIFVIPFAVVAADEYVDPADPPADPTDDLVPDGEPRGGSSSGGCRTGAATALLLLLPALARFHRRG